jgi:integrase
MNTALPRYASAFTDRHGTRRIRLRRTGWKTHYVKADPGTPEFTVEYHAWLSSAKPETESRAKPGTFDDLISRYYRSTRFNDLSPSTQATYRGELERFRAKYGDRKVATMTARHIDTLMQTMADTPSAANNLRKRLGQLFKYANLLGMRTDNPARMVSALKTRKGGFKTWQEAQIAQFEAAHPVGTLPRLAFDLALYTAQRRSDIRSMGPQHIEAGKIRVCQLKTGKPLLIPIHPNLARSIAATPTGHLAFIVSSRGAPYTKESFGNWFHKHCTAAGLEGYSLHGLRKAASRRMAEIGLSNQLIKSITGHSTDTEVSRYTREAEQARMAELAMESLAHLANPDLATHRENGGNLR